MSLQQRMDRLTKAAREPRYCRLCAMRNPIRTFVLHDEHEPIPAWPGPEDPRECPACGRHLTYVSTVLCPGLHRPPVLQPEGDGGRVQ
jgi:hypothetical protein